MTKAAPLVILAGIAALNFFTGGLKKSGVFEELPRAFASAAPGKQVGGSRDLLLVAAGQRTLAADFAMIDTLVYYGTHVHETAEGEQGEGRHYLDLFALMKRILALDPFFRYALVYGSGALAFNEERGSEAVELLQEARKRDPKYWTYSLLLSSIAYKKAGDYAGIIASLESVVNEPDCPTMLKNVLANFYLKIRNNEQAIRLLLDIYENAPEKSYRQSAEDRLIRLGIFQPR